MSVYRYHSLQFSPAPEHRCAAVLHSDVILPETIHQSSELGAGPSGPRRSPSPVHKAREAYVINERLDDKGMFARVWIPQGGVILAEHPALILPRDVKLESLAAGLEITGPQHSNPYDALFSRVDHKEIFALKDCLTKGVGASKGIFHTNALNIELEARGRDMPELQKYQALFLVTSRCNHRQLIVLLSCGPNAVWRFDPLTFKLTLSAVRRISPGEEITISYINPFLPRHLRRAKLQSRWNFVCHCNHCDVPWTIPGAVVQSDKARQELCTFFDDLPDWAEWCAGNDRRDLIDIHLRAMWARDREGLQGFRGGNGAARNVNFKDLAYTKHIDALVMCYGALGDVEGFRAWVAKAREAKVAGGPDSAAHVKVLDMWLREPRKFHVWGWKTQN
ncbi:hypothetical protein BDP27DRAFT_1208202 [Rhodocollybia butyracea]|uniref:SET domain-containing protein n=1 Tax=Rhodocollybia butyracea TaxID=206335 RepID=A0A9P5UGJ5_9AGAR|nr:hypothetical protein BDP27DRAFT_1208202 [Rhodocollybia butyracea]